MIEKHKIMKANESSEEREGKEEKQRKGEKRNYFQYFLLGILKQLNSVNRTGPQSTIWLMGGGLIFHNSFSLKQISHPSPSQQGVYLALFS